MKNTLFVRIFVGYLLVVLVMAVTIPMVSFRLIREDHLKSSQQDLHDLGIAAQDSLKPLLNDHAALERGVASLGQRLGKRLTVVDPTGRVLADSSRDAESMENHSGRPEIAAALKGYPGYSTRYSTTLGRDMLYVALPIKDQGQLKGVIRLSCDLAGINSLLGLIRSHIFKLSLALSFLMLLIALAFASLIARPVHALSLAARRVADGDFKVRVAHDRFDEVGKLCESFNHMTERLDQTFADLSSTKQTLESIIAAIPDALLVVNDQGRIQLLNESARRISGMAAGTAPSERYYWEFLRSEEIAQALNEPGNSVRELRLGNFYYLMSVARIGETASRVILLTDISELKRIEQVKRDLVVNVSHELRTPLTAIKGFTETMIEAGQFEPEYLEIIARHTERLINIVGDLLNLSELENGATALDLAPLDLGSLLKNLARAFDDKAGRKGLTLELAIPQDAVMVRADAFRLEQLFTNLIDNAIKYTDQGRVSIAVTQMAEGAEAIVVDSGPGIAEEHLSRIFERFYVVDKSRSRKLGGTGLGLSIAKHIASLHGAELSVSSQIGEGSVFTVRFR